MPDLRTVSRSEFVRHCHPDRTPVSTPAAPGLFSDAPESAQPPWIPAARSTAPHGTIVPASGAFEDDRSRRGPRRLNPRAAHFLHWSSIRPGSPGCTVRPGGRGGPRVSIETTPECRRSGQVEQDSPPLLPGDPGDGVGPRGRLDFARTVTRGDRRRQLGRAGQRRAMARR